MVILKNICNEIKKNKNWMVYIIFILFILYVIYSYISVITYFNQSYQNFIDNSGFNNQQIIQYFENATINEPLIASINILKPNMALNYSLMIINSLGPLLFIFIGAFIFGIEYRYDTIKQLLNKNLNRNNIIYIKLLTLIFIIFLFIISVYIISLLISYISISNLDIPISLNKLDNYKISKYGYFHKILGTLVSMFFAAVFGGLVTILSKNYFSGLMIGIVYPIMESTIMFSTKLPFFIQASMLPILFPYQGGNVSFDPINNVTDTYTYWESISYSLLYLLLFIIISLIVFRKQKFF